MILFVFDKQFPLFSYLVFTSFHSNLASVYHLIKEECFQNICLKLPIITTRRTNIGFLVRSIFSPRWFHHCTCQWQLIIYFIITWHSVPVIHSHTWYIITKLKLLISIYEIYILEIISIIHHSWWKVDKIKSWQITI